MLPNKDLCCRGVAKVEPSTSPAGTQKQDKTGKQFLAELSKDCSRTWLDRHELLRSYCVLSGTGLGHSDPKQKWICGSPRALRQCARSIYTSRAVPVPVMAMAPTAMAHVCPGPATTAFPVASQRRRHAAHGVPRVCLGYGFGMRL